jgi:hypothetical protein
MVKIAKLSNFLINAQSGKKQRLKTHEFLHVWLRPAIFKYTNGIIYSPDPFIPKLPYDKANVPVKRNNVFRRGDHRWKIGIPAAVRYRIMNHVSKYRHGVFLGITYAGFR